MTDRMNPTDQATQLTQEAEEFIGDCRLVGMLDGAHGSNEPFFRSALRAIETAAARRAIEGSGVVEALEAISRMTLRPLPERHAVDPVAWYRHVLSSIGATADATLAALPRPQEPRVERCEKCGLIPDSNTHNPSSPGYRHPFTPEAR